jgi:CRP-like cAMP-binding protein
MSNDVQQLRATVERFVKLPDADWELLLPHIHEKNLNRHGLFAAEGRRSFDVGFVIDGMFRQYYSKDGDEKTTYFYFPGDLVCAYVSCLTNQPSLVTIQALSDARYLSFPYSVLLDLYSKSIPWQTFGRLIAEYIAIGLEERMASLLLLSPEERYKELLAGPKKKIIERLPQQYIANYLGITPVSMSRIRARITSK